MGINERYLEAMKDKSGFRSWNYEPQSMAETGYEGVYDKLREYKSEEYLEMTKEEKERVQDEVLAIYRSVNLFPITYYNELGILNEIQKCREYKIRDHGEVISEGAGVGTGLCNFLFPNLYDVISAQDLKRSSEGAESALKKFYNDDWLKRAIHFALEYGGTSPMPRAVYSGLGLIGSMATNFKPMVARNIWERYTNDGDVVWDYCMGFGGRMLGALTSPKNLTYVGTDPNSETFAHLQELGEHIEKVTGRSGSFDIHCMGAEEYFRGDDTIDFAFASPPYFNLELYSTEETQSTMKYPELAGWLEGFVRPTIKNIYRMLKPGKFYAVNIADFNLPGGEKVNFVDAWSQISEEEGFTRMPNIYMGISARAGSLEHQLGENKLENILVFKSNKSIW